MAADRDISLLEEILFVLGRSGSLAELLQPCTEALVRHFDLAFARIWLLDPDGSDLVLRASAGQYTHLDGPHGRIPVGAFKIGRIAARRQPHVTNDVGTDPHISDPEWARREGMVAFAGFPLLAGEDLVGVVGMFARHVLDEGTLGTLGPVADSLAVGVHRVQAATELARQREATTQLHEIGAALAQELDLQRLVQAVTDAATELSGAQFGAFFYNVETDLGESYLLYTLSGASQADFEGFPLPRNTAVFGPTFAGERPVRHHDVTQAEAFGQNPPYYGMPKGHLPVRSYLAVPVVARSGEVLGGLFFAHGEPGMFGEDHERLVVGIAGYASIAIENARLFERERAAAVTLQRSLLPARLPQVSGVRLGVAYLPASHHAEIGGDWYDALALDDGRLAITIGDVGGHDLRAAGIMGQLRSAIRMSVLGGRDPDGVLVDIDRYLTFENIDRITTMIQAELEPGAGRLRIASAGHPAPLVLGPDRAARYIDVAPGPVLGYGLFESGLGQNGMAVDLEPGTTLIFFTDGLFERRGVPDESGLDRLLGAARAAEDRDPDALCKHLIESIVGSDRDQGDDVALLVVHVGSG